MPRIELSLQNWSLAAQSHEYVKITKTLQMSLLSKWSVAVHSFNSKNNTEEKREGRYNLKSAKKLIIILNFHSVNIWKNFETKPGFNNKQSWNPEVKVHTRSEHWGTKRRKRKGLKLYCQDFSRKYPSLKSIRRRRKMRRFWNRSHLLSKVAERMLRVSVCFSSCHINNDFRFNWNLSVAETVKTWNWRISRGINFGTSSWQTLGVMVPVCIFSLWKFFRLEPPPNF